MDPDVARFAQVLLVIGTFVAGVIAIALVTRVAWGLTDRKKRVSADSATPRIDDSRFARLEDAVDSIAVEVERIAEAQRFSAKLLSERATERNAEESAAQQRRIAPDSR